MKLFRPFLIVLPLFIVTIVFFYPVFTKGYIPFPGDLLVSEYKPWQAYSYLGYNPGSYPNKAQYFDTIRQLYPWRLVSSTLLGKLQLPLWNPYNFSGSPLLANFQSAVFYPLTLLFLLMPIPIAWTLGVVGQHFLAGVFTYLFVRKLGVSKSGALVAAITYSFSLFMSVFSQYNSIGHTIAWLPLALYSVELFIQSGKPLTLVILVTSLALSLFAGHLQLFGLLFGYTFVYAIFRICCQKQSSQNKAKHIFLIAAALLLSLGVGAVQLVPTIELLQLSARVSQSYQFLIEKLLIQPFEIIKIFSPDIFGNPATRNYLLTDTYPSKALYVGLIPLMFAFLAILNRFKEGAIRFFAASVGILLLFLIRSPFTEIFYRLNIPIISSSSPSNALFLVSFGLAVLSGFGVDLCRERRKVSVAILTVGLAYLLLLTVTLALHIPVRPSNAFYSAGVWGCLLVVWVVSVQRFSWQKIGLCFIMVVAVVDLLYFFRKFNPFVPKELIYPATSVTTWLRNHAGINRFWGYGSAAIEANFASALTLYSPDGYDPLYPSRYGKLLVASGNGSLPPTFSNQTRSDAVVAPGYGELDLPSNPYRLKLLNILGVKYILDRVENQSTVRTFPTDTYTLVYESDGWKVFENKNALPRVFLANQYRVFSGDREFENIFFDSNFDPTKTILLEQRLPYAFSESNFIGTAQISDYSPNRIVINTSAGQAGLLFLSDTYYPGWKAAVDGAQTAIYRADYTFRALYLPPGKHTVEFHYQPDSLYIGAKITMISTALFVFISVFIIKRRNTL